MKNQNLYWEECFPKVVVLVLEQWNNFKDMMDVLTQSSSQTGELGLLLWACDTVLFGQKRDVIFAMKGA